MLRMLSVGMLRRMVSHQQLVRRKQRSPRRVLVKLHLMVPKQRRNVKPMGMVIRSQRRRNSKRMNHLNPNYRSPKGQLMLRSNAVFSSLMADTARGA